MKLPRPRYSLATLLGLVAVCAVLSWGVPTLWHYWTVGRHVEVFKDPTQDDKVRHEAEEALVKVGSPAVLDLVRLIKEEKTDTVRGQAAFALSQISPTAL